MLAVVAAVGFVAWVIWELTDAAPVVDLTLYRNRNFAIGGIVFCLGYAVFFANILLFPLWLQTQMGYTALYAGFVAAPSGIVAVLVTPFVARLSGKVDTRLLATVAFLAFMAAYYLRSQFTTSASLWDFTFPSLIQGIGMSTFFLGMTTIVLDRIRRAAAVRHGAVELHPDRRGLVLRVDRDDLLGPARGAASGAAGGRGGQSRAGPAGSRRARAGRAGHDARRRRADAAIDRAGLSARHHRPVLVVGGAVGEPGGAGVDDAATGGRRRAGRGRTSVTAG